MEGKKLEIAKHAFDRFYADGFRATGMEAVVAGTGISKRTLYKYFSSKEELIEAVLFLYSEAVVDELFGPVAGINDPREQIIAFFDVERFGGRFLTRGCLGMKAAQEYAGRHAAITQLGIQANLRGQEQFLALCRKAGFSDPLGVARQLSLVLQGALVLSHGLSDTAPFHAAREAAIAILERAAVAPKGGDLMDADPAGDPR